MAGCCVVVLAIIMTPIMIVCAAALITLRFVFSPAGFFFLASCACGIAAIIDAVRVLWLRRGGTSDEPLSVASFKRPFVLLAISAVLFIVMAILAGTMIMDWYEEVLQYSQQ